MGLAVQHCPSVRVFSLANVSGRPISIDLSTVSDDLQLFLLFDEFAHDGSGGGAQSNDARKRPQLTAKHSHAERGADSSANAWRAGGAAAEVRRTSLSVGGVSLETC